MRQARQAARTTWARTAAGTQLALLPCCVRTPSTPASQHRVIALESACPLAPRQRHQSCASRLSAGRLRTSKRCVIAYSLEAAACLLSPPSSSHTRCPLLNQYRTVYSSDSSSPADRQRQAVNEEPSKHDVKTPQAGLNTVHSSNSSSPADRPKCRQRSEVSNTVHGTKQPGSEPMAFMRSFHAQHSVQQRRRQLRSRGRTAGGIKIENSSLHPQVCVRSGSDGG